MAPTTTSGGEPALVSQCLDFCKALASKGQTISASRNLGSNFSFNLEIRWKETSPNEKVTLEKEDFGSTVDKNWKRRNLLHMKPLYNEAPCDSQVINIVRKTADSASGEHWRCPSRKQWQEVSRYTCSEQRGPSCRNQVWTVWFYFLNNCVLRTHKKNHRISQNAGATESKKNKKNSNDPRQMKQLNSERYY